jgi:hypothetical protein
VERRCSSTHYLTSELDGGRYTHILLLSTLYMLQARYVAYLVFKKMGERKVGYVTV